MRQDGQSYFQIASSLDISENTVKSYCRRNNLGVAISIRPLAIKEINLVCKQCRKPLNQGMRGNTKKFCSEECRRSWWKTHDSSLKRKAYYTLVCAECGRKFESYGNKSRKYCSHTCYIQARFEKGGESHVTRAI
jgi:endogenous inhibitor of DNA gyrase (YacG/DUF329 family)